MTPVWRTALRTLVIGAGAVVLLASMFTFQRGDWPIYVAFVLMSFVVFIPSVEVLPNLVLGIPELAVIIGFLYIGGLPILVLAQVPALLTQQFLRRRLPEPWRQYLPQVDAIIARRDLFTGGQTSVPQLLAEVATFSLGLGMRWWVVHALVPHGAPTAHPGAMAVAEGVGYACWGLLAVLPIYPDRTLMPLSVPGGLRAALTDIGLVVALALTPFVFLMAYGYQTEGLSGAVAWGLATLGLHFMLRRLNERRIKVEEQNRRLESLNRELEHRERLSAIGKMSSVVSHQILQQLGVIGIYADLIRNADGSADPHTALAQVRHNAGAIEGALRDVNRVLTDLLVFSKDLRLNLYEHHVGHLIDECLAECRAAAAQRAVDLRTEGAPDVTVTLDKLKMKQALVNIIRNAIEASPPGESVVVRADGHEREVEIAVSDQGAGVPERDRAAIFTPFFTTKEHGTGLGLAIAHAFTEAHGGRLWVEPRPDGPGARFIVRLPIAAADGRSAGGA
jgi:signal transduction histidine kinase